MKQQHSGPLNESSSRRDDDVVKQEEYDDVPSLRFNNDESNVSHSDSATTPITANKSKRRGKKAPAAAAATDISSDSLPPLPMRISTTMVGPVAMKVTGKRRFVDDSLLTADDAKKVNAIRAYNRACATRSRHKTKLCIQELRSQVEQLQGEKDVLATEHDRLQHQVDLMTKHNQMLMWTRAQTTQATTQTTTTQCGVGNSNTNSNTGGNNTNISNNANFTNTNAMMMNNVVTCFPSQHFYNGSISNSTSALRPVMSLGDVLQNSSNGSGVGPLQFQFQQHLLQQQQLQQQQQFSDTTAPTLAQKWNATKS